MNEQPTNDDEPAPWPEEHSRRCERCGCQSVKVIQRINRTGAPALCPVCFG